MQNNFQTLVNEERQLHKNTLSMIKFAFQNVHVILSLSVYVCLSMQGRGRGGEGEMERGRDQESLVIAKRLNQQNYFLLLERTCYSTRATQSYSLISSAPSQIVFLPGFKSSTSLFSTAVLLVCLSSQVQDPKIPKCPQEGLTLRPQPNYPLYFCYANYTVYFDECCMCFVKKKKNV